MSKNKISQHEVAKELGISRCSVQVTQKRYANVGYILDGEKTFKDTKKASEIINIQPLINSLSIINESSIINEVSIYTVRRIFEHHH